MATSERLSFVPAPGMKAEGAQLLGLAGDFGRGFDSHVFAYRLRFRVELGQIASEQVI